MYIRGVVVSYHSTLPVWGLTQRLSILAQERLTFSIILGSYKAQKVKGYLRSL